MADSPFDPDAGHFSQVTSGIYRRVIPESVWLAIQYAVRHELPAENPTIMIMFVRIAEVYADVRQYLESHQADASDAEAAALKLILDPPPGIKNAEYLPSEVQSPGEMDLCWSEFLVTGSTDPIQTVVAVLDRDDVSRPLIDQLLSQPDSDQQIGPEEIEQLAAVGIALGRSSDEGPWRIMSPGDIDLLLWFGVKDKNPACERIMQRLDEGTLVHVATKGAALWSLKANACQHGKIRLFCEEQSKIEGGVGRVFMNQQ